MRKWVSVKARKNPTSWNASCALIDSAVCGSINIITDFQKNSRRTEEAREALDNHRYNYSPRAVVYCASGCYTNQYKKAYREAERKAKEAPDGR